MLLLLLTYVVIVCFSHFFFFQPWWKFCFMLRNSSWISCQYHLIIPLVMCLQACVWCWWKFPSETIKRYKMHNFVLFWANNKCEMRLRGFMRVWDVK
jgi:hypothetical protein